MTTEPLKPIWTDEEVAERLASSDPVRLFQQVVADYENVHIIDHNRIVAYAKESAKLREQVAEQGAELSRLRAELAAAKRWEQSAQEVIALGVQLMPLEQLSQWTGVRAVQESGTELTPADSEKAVAQ